MKTIEAGLALCAIIIVATVSAPVLARNATGVNDCRAEPGAHAVRLSIQEFPYIFCQNSPSEALSPPAGKSISGSTILWEQTAAGGSNIPSSSAYWMPDGAGIYSASDFVLWSDATIDLIFAEGLNYSSGSLISLPAIDWAIYPDANGVPSGHPEDGNGAEVWAYSSPPTGPGVDVADDNILLDLSAAGQNLQLPAGRYWLVVYPTYTNPAFDPAWFWYDASTQIGSFSQVVDPQDIYGAGATSWDIWPIYSYNNIDDMAFRIEGTVTGPEPSQYIPITTLNSDPNPPAGWSESFDSYGTGVPLHGVGGWKGWANDPALGASTSAAQARTAPNSVDISGAADLVQEFAIDSGVWTFTARQYIPADFTGMSYFILLNEYDDACTACNWSVQVNFAGGIISNTGVNLGAMLYKTDEWVEIRVEIDLIRNQQRFYYDGKLLYSGTWSEEVSGGGSASIAALDLFANGSSSVYYDDFSLTKR